MSVLGFNVGIGISLGDMELALNYFNDKDVFEPELEQIKERAGKSTRIAEGTVYMEEDTQDVTEKSTDEPYTYSYDDSGTEDAEYDAYESEENTAECIEEQSATPDETSEEDDDMAGYFDDEEEPQEEEENTVDQTETTEDEDDDMYLGMEGYEDEEEEQQVEAVVETVVTPAPAIQKQQSSSATSVSKPDVNIEQKNKTNELRQKLDDARRAREEAERQLEEDSELERLIAEEERKREEAETVAKQRQDNARRLQLEQQRAAQAKKVEAPVRKHPTDVITHKIKEDTGTIHGTTSNMVANLVNRDNDRVAKTQTDTYSSMDIESLFREVKEFMLQNGVQKQQLDMASLESKFGKMNITKLITKSYLIITKRGVTIGR